MSSSARSSTSSRPLEISVGSESSLRGAGRLEVCDALNVDENCNGVADDADSGTVASTKSRYFADVDEDSFGDMDDPGTALCDDPSTSTSFYVTDSSDCDDSRADISPGASEVCDVDDIDEDCDGVSDDGDSSVLSTSKTLFFIAAPE